MKVRWFTYLVMLYLLVAVSWWTILLFNKNKTEYDALNRLNKTTYFVDPESLQKDFERQNQMIISESIFLGLSLLAGIWIIYRGNRRELHSINNQNNFLLAITHELKSPLASVKLILNTLKSRRLEDDLKNHLLNTAQTEINRLDDMIHNLLLSPDSQSFSISSELIQIEELILELLNSEHFKNSEIELNVCRDSSHLMKADKKYLPIAIKNVLENAIKYGSDEPIILNINATNNQTEIEIKDSGPGIPQEEKAHIFKRFYRLGNEWTRSTKGTGLGLYISKKIIDAHNGRIEVLNNYPTGAIFKIILPSNAS